ncbi:hypothetical protein J7M28_07035 [bacterium]|nr:hypothetical protein [bacterium]
MNINDKLKTIATNLRRIGIEYALCGGPSVAVHEYPRATQDIDMLIRESDLNQATALLCKMGYCISTGMIPSDVGRESKLQVYRISKASGGDVLTLDLVLVSPILEDVWQERETFKVDDYEVTVVSLSGLKKMKRLSGRPQDLVDIGRLEELERIDEPR